MNGYLLLQTNNKVIIFHLPRAHFHYSQRRTVKAFIAARANFFFYILIRVAKGQYCELAIHLHFHRCRRRSLSLS